MHDADLFDCSPHILFQPVWEHIEFDETLSHQIHTNCFIIPANQEQLKKELETFGLNNLIVTLHTIDDFEMIHSLCHGAIKPHFIFISQSMWADKYAREQHILFLKLLQDLKRYPQFKLSVVVLNALKGPALNLVTNPLDAVYLGLAKTFAKEMPSAEILSINIEKITSKLLSALGILDAKPNSLSPCFLTDTQYSFKKLQPIEYNNSIIPGGFKHKGCYLIIGGTGGIGSLLAEYLCKTYQAKVILVSRRVPDQEMLQRFSTMNVIFEQADLADELGIKELFGRHPAINGIIHSALVLDDASIMTMSERSLTSVLTPKVQGTLNLIKAISFRHFDFILFFSSIQSFIANAGQANYTAACLAKDALAEMIEDAFNIKTCIINWGYWGELGIVANDFYRQRMRKQQIGSITADEGLAVIEYCLQQNLKQVVMVKGSENTLRTMGIGLNLTTNRQERRSLLPLFDKQNKEVQNNKAMMDALEHYTRNKLYQIDKPQTIAAKYQKLWEAVSHVAYSPSPTRTELSNRYPELKAHLNLIDICLSHLATIVSGQTCPISVMFPEGGFSLVEPVYRNNPVADYYNQCVADAVEAYVNQAMQMGKRTRILEVGAGTGSTSEKVLPRLKNKSVHYVYSDLSHAFLNKARKEFSEYDFIEYKILNIETTVKDLNSFDIILATNVIHATADIQQSVNNLFNLLAVGGVLLLNEITSRQDFATLTFGLTDGWWLSQDSLRIPYSPLLDLATWKKVLGQAGFTSSYDHGDFGQHIIEAHKTSLTHKVANPIVNQVSNSRQLPALSANTESDRASIWLKKIIADVLHMDKDEIHADIPFSEYGIDSLISLELIKPISEKLGYIPATLLFEYPTLTKLAEFLRQNFTTVFTETPLIVPQNKTVDAMAIIPLIRQAIAKVLHMSEQEIEENLTFSELGIDSLISLEVVNELKQKLGYLPATILFEYPTIATLAEYIIHNNSLIDGKYAIKLEPVTEPVSHQVQQDHAGYDVAIVGIAAKVPNADNCDQLWDLLCEGKDAFKPIPSERWIAAKNSKSYTQTASLINDISCFDHEFFNIAPVDAERMDPQERLFLQTTYHAIEDAGLNIKQLDGQNIGCYVGVMNHGYSWLSLNNANQGEPSSLFWSIANRVSYQFNWHGPSFAIDSACSSSLTALHTAITAILQGDCDMAVVGGVNLIPHPRQIDVLCQLHMLSASNQCKPFGEKADGFVDGEGIISIVIMPYQKAISEHLKIYGVIRGSAINSGGKANGYSAPNPKAQAALIKKALDKAQLQANNITFIEAHGTGTELGDPIEIRALSEAYAGSNNQSIPIGSIKGNLGHLESAAGLASVVKVLLQMKHKKLVPSLHSYHENPHLHLEKTPFFINKKMTDWKQQEPLRAAVSSFGAGGANAHIILESCESKLSHSAQNKQAHYLFALSGHSEGALQKELINLRQCLLEQQDDLLALSYGYCCIRTAQKTRLGIVVNNREELIALCSKTLANIRTFIIQQTTPSLSKSPEELVTHYINSNKSEITDALALMQAFNQGLTINFKPLFQSPQFHSLPNYPFDKHRHWVNAKETRLSHRNEIVKQHIIQEQAIAPAALSLSMFYERAPFKCINNILWKKIITNPELLAVIVDDDGYRIYDPEGSMVYSQAEIGFNNAVVNKAETDIRDYDARILTAREIYHYFENKGYHYGPDFRGIVQAKISDQKISSILFIEQDWGYSLSPSLIDCALQTAILTDITRIQDHSVKIPFLIEQLLIHKIPDLCQPVYCLCTSRDTAPGNSSCFDIELSDSHGNLLIALKGVVSIKSTTAKLFSTAETRVIGTKTLNIVELN